MRSAPGENRALPGRPTSISLDPRLQRQAAVDLFNYVWTLLENPDRTERESELMPNDPWRNGLAANRKNIEDFAAYSYEQGLIRRRLTPDELFVGMD